MYRHLVSPGTVRTYCSKANPFNFTTLPYSPVHFNTYSYTCSWVKSICSINSRLNLQVSAGHINKNVPRPSPTPPGASRLVSETSSPILPWPRKYVSQYKTPIGNRAAVYAEKRPDERERERNTPDSEPQRDLELKSRLTRFSSLDTSASDRFRLWSVALMLST